MYIVQVSNQQIFIDIPHCITFYLQNRRTALKYKLNYTSDL